MRAFAGKTVPRTVFWPGSLLPPKLDLLNPRVLGHDGADEIGEVFFMRLLGFWILPGMARANGRSREVQPRQ